MKEIEILGVKIEYDKGYVTVFNSYEVTSQWIMAYVLTEFKDRTGYKSKRSLNSWIREWKAHNRLYRLGLFESHTKDCDLEENEKWYRRLVYWFIGF